ncbi:hypothetical protein QBC39DRAFT_247005, partial [Podospora conica]
QPRFFPELKSQRILTKYGPLSVPPSGGNHAMGNFDFPVPSPCTDCVVTQYTFNIEYADGSYANANTGTYLHHAVFLNFARRMATCSAVDQPELAFASGNERTVASFSLNGTRKSGYNIKKSDIFYITAELMSDAAAARDVVITVDWEFVPSVPSDFKHVTPVWISADGPCLPLGGEVPIPANQTAFTLAMDPAWKSTIAGEIIGAFSHAHDGVEQVRTLRNGQVVCSSKVRYGETPGYGGGHHHGRRSLGRRHEDIPRVSSLSTCTNVGRIEVGDLWSVQADYNLVRHKPMGGEGHLEPVMGISIMHVIEDPK